MKSADTAATAPERQVVLLVATLASFVTPFMGAAVNVALPTIGSELSLDAIALGWVSTVYLLTAVVLLLPLGRWADIHGRLRVFLGGAVLYTAASVLSALAPSGGFLIAARVVQGAGGAMFFATGVAMISSVFPPGERGRALGLNVAAVYSGLSLGPVVAGILTHQLGWRSVFWANALLGLVVVVVTRLKLKRDWVEPRDEALDWLGSLLYAGSLIALTLGLAELPHLLGLLLVAGAVVAVVLFVRWELAHAQPILDMRLLADNLVFAFSNLAALMNYSATFAVGFFLSLYLQTVRGFSPQVAGGILVSQPLFMALLSPLAGRLSDRVESRIVASLGMALTVLGLVALAFLDVDTPLWLIIVPLMVLGVGFAFFSSPNANAVMSSVDPRFYGVASATLGTTRLLGQMLSMASAMVLFVVFVGEAKISAATAAGFLTSMRYAFAGFAGICLVGVFISLKRGPA